MDDGSGRLGEHCRRLESDDYDGGGWVRQRRRSAILPDQATTVNTATAAIPFTMDDADTPVGNLTLSGGSSNPTLVPTNNIVFGGVGANRTVTVTPAAGQTGSCDDHGDGERWDVNSASDTFVLTVNAVNTPPTITGIADQTINEDTARRRLSFTVGDAETCGGESDVERGFVESDAGADQQHCVWRERSESDGDGDSGGQSEWDGDDHGERERRAVMGRATILW